MAANVESIGQLERRVNIALPSAEIDGEVQTRLKGACAHVQNERLQAGEKCRSRWFAQQYADQVRREVLTDALQKGFAQAIREQNLRVAGYPRFEPGRRSGCRARRSSSARLSRSILK
jgi:trigger factor